MNKIPYLKILEQFLELLEYFFRRFDHVLEPISSEVYPSEISSHDDESIRRIRPLDLSQDTHPCSYFSIIIFALESRSLRSHYPICRAIMRRFAKICISEK